MRCPSYAQIRNVMDNERLAYAGALAAFAIVAIVRRWQRGQEFQRLKTLYASGVTLEPAQVRELISYAPRESFYDSEELVRAWATQIPDADIPRLLEVSERLGQLELAQISDRILRYGPPVGGNLNIHELQKFVHATDGKVWIDSGFDVVAAFDGFVPRAKSIQWGDLPLISQFAKGQSTWKDAVLTLNEQIEELRFQVRSLVDVEKEGALWEFTDAVTFGGPLTQYRLDYPRSVAWVDSLSQVNGDDLTRLATLGRANWGAAVANLDDLTVARLAEVDDLLNFSERMEIMVAACERIGQEAQGWTEEQWKLWVDGVLANPQDPLRAPLMRQVGEDWMPNLSHHQDERWQLVRWSYLATVAENRVSLRHLKEQLSAEELALCAKLIKCWK